jgi:hypothetical protein
MRVCSAIRGFYSVHGAWPTRIRLEQGYIDEFRDWLFTPASWSKVQQKLTFVPDDAPGIFAEDEAGRRFRYSHDEEGRTSMPTSVADWLGADVDRDHEGKPYER